MRREDLQREIARLDEEINQVIGSAELPSLDIRPFPRGTWFFGVVCLAYAYFGYMIPGGREVHQDIQQYARWLGMGMIVLAVISTIFWLFKGRGYQQRSDSYMQASRRARDLKEKRQEIQAELRSLVYP